MTPPRSNAVRVGHLVCGFMIRVSGFRSNYGSLMIRVWVSGLTTAVGFRVQGSGFRVSGFGS